VITDLSNSRPKRYPIAVWLISLATLLIYSNTFDASWHLDDYENIVMNPGIKMTRLDLDSINQSFHASVDGGEYFGDSLYRPVAMFSFALNWYMGQDNVWGYHILNLLIHILSGITLLFTVALILRTPNVDLYTSSLRYHAALLSSLIWCIHPIQTSSVTYIIQRMASLAGLFYLLGLLFFLKLRFSQQKKSKWIYSGCWAIAFLLAMGTKQNTILLPVSCLLMELIFFRKFQKKDIGYLVVALVGAGLFLVFSAMIWTNWDIGYLFRGYVNRPFSPIERLLTQSRIVCFYIWQIVYPVASQYSVEHEFTVSKSLLSPWTTTLALAMIVGLIGFALSILRRYPLTAFAILFFFLNHSVESTILNLELVFEHRNYIPSMFVFVPASVWVCRHIYLENKELKNTWKAGGALFFLVFFLFTGLGTYTRNLDWKTEKSLWESALENAPQRARPYQSLGTQHYQKMGLWDQAIAYHKMALEKRDSKPSTAKMVSYDNLRFYYIKKGDLEKAVEYSRKAVNAKSGIRIVYNYIETLMLAGKIDSAATAIEKFLAQRKKPKLRELNLQTLILLKQKRSEQALNSALNVVKLAPNNADAVCFFGYANMNAGNIHKADHYLRKALNLNTNYPIYVRLCLIQNSINNKNNRMASHYIAELMELFPVKQVVLKLNEIKAESYPLVDLDTDRLYEMMMSYLNASAEFGLTGM
jgi:tetratricopeptide (TPR) repeat protein